MSGRRSLGQYRAVDLLLLALLLLVFESVIQVASLRWFPGQPYTVSLTPAITAIVLVRWGPWAAIHAVLGGAVVCHLSGAAPFQYAIYCVGNLFSLLALPFLARWRKENGVFSSGIAAAGFSLAVLLLMQLGRAVMTLLFGAVPTVAVGCFTTEAITDLFTVVILWITRRLDGVLEDQGHYLRRVQAEERARGGAAG